MHRDLISAVLDAARRTDLYLSPARPFAGDAPTTPLDPAALGDRETTLLVKSLLIPRPIAWVGTLSSDGVPNLAPHSFFTVASSEPPIVLIGSTGRKDTLRNAEATGAFTVSLVTRALAEPTGPRPPSPPRWTSSPPRP